MIFEFLRQKWCRIIMSFRQNTISGPETCQIGPKVWNRTCPDLPRLVLLSKFIISCINSLVLLNKFIILYKIIGFTNQIYHFSNPYRKTTFIFFFTDFTPFIFLINNFMIFIKINDFLSKIRPIWAHKGPILNKKLIILMKNHKIINKNIKVVNLEILKVKTWFGDKDLFS